MSYLELYESKAEQEKRALVAARCATPWRDANVRKRGDRFKQPVIADDTKTTERVKRNGETIKVRGCGFYGGWKK